MSSVEWREFDTINIDFLMIIYDLDLVKGIDQVLFVIELIICRSVAFKELI